jgi:hypothetical protein
VGAEEATDEHPSEQPAGDVDIEPLADRASLEDLYSHEDPECDQHA